MLFKDKRREAAILGGVAAAFLVAAIAVFVTRPGYDDLDPLPGAGPAAAAKGSGASAAFAGRQICRLVPDRSRITVSSVERVDLEWSETGCVNGRTQYLEDGDAWRRILVPQGDQTVSVLEVRPVGRQYVVNRYLLSADAMQRARALRQRLNPASCTGEEAAMTALAEGQEQIRQILPGLPNERLVYDCTPAGG
jgi:hypothetical protein